MICDELILEGVDCGTKVVLVVNCGLSGGESVVTACCGCGKKVVVVLVAVDIPLLEEDPATTADKDC